MRVWLTVGSMLVLAVLGCGGDDSGGTPGGTGGLMPIGGAGGLTGGAGGTTGGAVAGTGTGGTVAGMAGAGGMGGGTPPGCDAYEAMAPGTARGTYDSVAMLLRGPADMDPMTNGACTFSSCHSTTANKATLDLTAMLDITSVLVNVPSCQAEGLDRVEPGNPGMSWMWIKLAGPFDAGSGKVTFAATPKTCMSTTADAPLGLAMPWTGGPSVPLLPDQMFQICSWIEDGAAGPM